MSFSYSKQTVHVEEFDRMDIESSDVQLCVVAANSHIKSHGQCSQFILTAGNKKRMIR